ncbi:MAG: hypothetical protein PHY12_10055 [Eubacteriales bacterium]|nr:hypothetical protein [Eubacteriales bacterium]
MSQAVFYDDVAPQSAPYDRIYVRSSVYLPNSELDPRTGTLKTDCRRQGRTQAMRMEMKRLDKEYATLNEQAKAREQEAGRLCVSVRAAVLIVAVVAFVLGMALLFQQGTLTDQQKKLNRMNTSIADVQKTNAALSAELAEASDASVICYAAARDLGMIPAESAQAIHLSAVDTRPVQSTAYTVSAETTAVPAIASAE